MAFTECLLQPRHSAAHVSPLIHTEAAEVSTVIPSFIVKAIEAVSPNQKSQHVSSCPVYTELPNSGPHHVSPLTFQGVWKLSPTVTTWGAAQALGFSLPQPTAL